jgi:hypothetical protein
MAARQAVAAIGGFATKAGAGPGADHQIARDPLTSEAINGVASAERPFRRIRHCVQSTRCIGRTLRPIIGAVTSARMDARLPVASVH